MPKIVKVRNYSPPNLLEKFSSNDISPASGNELGSATKYSYNASSDLRLWIRFESGAPVDLVNYDPNDKPTIVYEGTEDSQEMTVYNNRMKSARFDNVINKNAKLTFPGGAGNNNIATFGDGTSSGDLPFSVSLWFKKINESDGSDAIDVFFTKGKDNSTFEYRAYYYAFNNRIYFQVFSNGHYNSYRGLYTILDLEDNEWHHLVFTYNGLGGTNAYFGMKIYVDGELKPVSSYVASNGSGIYNGMDGVSEIFYIGSHEDGDDEADGNMAELALWAKELSLEEIKAIYNWTYEDSVVKSGYTNLSSRISLRDLDNRPGCYPTKHRMGDKDRSGKANIFYEDLPIQFGNEIKDDFTNVPSEDLITTDAGFNQKKWSVSTGMTIRREAIQGSEGIIINDRCATFSGTGTGGKRYLRSSQKIRNPYRFYFELIEGPYQSSPILLALSAGDADETLKLEIATDSAFTSPITIATYTPTSNPNDNYKLVGKDKKPRRVVSLSTSDFPDLGADYYFRFVQETYTNNKNVWALANIEVEYANQDVRYPLLLNHQDYAGSKFANSLIALPHTSGTLTGVGRSVKGVSDLSNPFQDFSETISAFDETLAIENTNLTFFNEGLDPDIYPGFTSPTRSKTKFTIDLSPSEETTFGYNTRLTLPETPEVNNHVSQPYTTTPLTADDGTILGIGDKSGNGQRLMVYWNNSLKRWEKIGKPLHFGNKGSGVYQHNHLTELFSASCVGFSDVPLIGTGSGSTLPRDLSTVKLFSRDVLKTKNRPYDMFSFPYGPQYFGTGSFTVKAKDIGITKPFLLEKISLECELKLELASSSSLNAFTCRNFLLHTKFQEYVVVPARPIKLITPTFFMLRQFKDNFSINKTYKDLNSYYSPADGYNLSYSIPGNFKITSGSDLDTYVDTNRELITYAQASFFVTGANNASSDNSPYNSFRTSNHLTTNVEELINAGLGSDTNITIEHDDGPGDTSIDLSYTGSIIINSNVKNTAKFDNLFSYGAYVQKYSVPKTVGGILIAAGRYAQDAIFRGKDTIGRSDSSLKNSRGIVNGIMSFTPSDSKSNVVGGNSENPNESFPKASDIEKLSPYLILPEDDLILGWQYPLANGRKDSSFAYHPGTTSTAFNSMTLFGKSKLHLYGSEVVQNKEFHETVNQNLTSCAVYEHVIGDEKVVDQWQVAYRGELTGSYNNMSRIQLFKPDSNSNNDVIHITSGPNDLQIIGINRLRGQEKNNNTGYFSYSKSEDLYQKVYDIVISAGLSAASAYKLAVLYNENSSKHQSSEYFIDPNRKFSDLTAKGDYYVNSTYGTQQSDYDLVKDVYDYLDLSFVTLRKLFDNTSGVLGKKSPKYMFNSKHYGYYHDMFQQGKDSKFERISRQGFAREFDISVNSQSPVQIKFVSGTYEDTPDNKVYLIKDVDQYLEEFNFQSSNLSTAATSSMPYIDDNQSHNRTYLEQEYIAVPIF